MGVYKCKVFSDSIVFCTEHDCCGTSCCLFVKAFGNGMIGSVKDHNVDMAVSVSGTFRYVIIFAIEILPAVQLLRSSCERHFM